MFPRGTRSASQTGIGLGTAITAGYDSAGKAIPTSWVNNYCYSNAFRKNGTVCCNNVGQDNPILADGNPVCTAPGYSLIPEYFQNVSLVKLKDGRVQIVAGPPITEMSDPMPVPGDTRVTPPPAPTPKANVPYTPPPPAQASFADMLVQYKGPILVGGIVLIGALLLK